VEGDKAFGCVSYVEDIGWSGWLGDAIRVLEVG
jgi:hypothetical protein